MIQTLTIQGRHDASHVAAFNILGKMPAFRSLTHVERAKGVLGGTHDSEPAGLRVIRPMTLGF